MAHDVFISHSSKDKLTADAICSIFENNGIRCWIAPRDIVPGMEWVDSIIDGISASRVMILVLSSSSNASAQVKREVEQAISQDVIIIPFRIEEVELSKSFKYYLSGTHWMDALNAPIENHIQTLMQRVKLLLPASPAKLAQTQTNNAQQNTLATTQNPPETKTEIIFCPHCHEKNIISAGQIYANLHCQFCGKKISSPPAQKQPFMQGWKLKGLVFLAVLVLIIGFMMVNLTVKAPPPTSAEFSQVPKTESSSVQLVAISTEQQATAQQQAEANVAQQAELKKQADAKAAELAQQQMAVQQAIEQANRTNANESSLKEERPRMTGYVCNLDPSGDNFLSLRAGPNASYAELLRMVEGTVFDILNTKGSWYRVQLNNGNQGWVFSQWVCQLHSKSANTSTNNKNIINQRLSKGYVCKLDPKGDNFLSLRTGPTSSDYEILRMTAGTSVVILQTRKKWHQIQLDDGTVGWASTIFICPSS